MDDDGEDVIDMMDGEEEWGTMNEAAAADETNTDAAEDGEEASSLAGMAGGDVPVAPTEEEPQA